MRSPPWTNEENAACVALYFVMHRFAEIGKEYNKAAMIRASQGQAKEGDRVPAPPAPVGSLSARSRGSIEAKLMNVTAVLHDLGREDISMTEHGYRPLSNYQSDLKDIVIGLLAVRDEAVAGGFKA